MTRRRRRPTTHTHCCLRYTKERQIKASRASPFLLIYRQQIERSREVDSPHDEGAERERETFKWLMKKLFLLSSLKVDFFHGFVHIHLSEPGINGEASERERERERELIVRSLLSCLLRCAWWLNRKRHDNNENSSCNLILIIFFIAFFWRFQKSLHPLIFFFFLPFLWEFTRFFFHYSAFVCVYWADERGEEEREREH
jgi:hypothetical protein